MHSSRMRTARTLTEGGCLPGGSARGVSARGGLPGGCLPGGVSAKGGCLPGGCLPGGCVCQGGVCQGGVCQGGVCQGGCVPCDLSHHAFHVTCMLPPHQLRLNTSAAAYILLAHCMLGYTPPSCGQTDTCKLITLPETSFAGGNKH